MNLSPTKRALLEKWLQGQSSANVNEPIIPKRSENSPIKMSFPQQGRLFIELLERDTAVNNLSVLLQLDGRLNLLALETSANQILERHEVLRTYFSLGMDIPRPELLNSLKIKIPVVELQELDENESLIKARQLAETEVLKPFDLSQAPLLKLTLYRLRSEKHLLLLLAHHTISDGWSLGVFLKELMSFYQSNTTGQPANIPNLPIQYFDYAQWQASEKYQASLQPSLSYWEKQLGGELPALELPTDRIPSKKLSFKGRTHRFVISSETTAAIEAFSRQENVTLFMTLLSAFYILLHKYSGQNDILVGSPIANRNLPELEPLIGVFINTIVLRAKIAEEYSFRAFLQQVKRHCLDAYTHQSFPFEQLIQALKPTRSLNRTPFFQVVFNLQNAPMPSLEIEGLQTSFLEIEKGVSQLDFTLMISQIEGECRASVEYNTDLFNSETIERMFESYQMILGAVITNPEKPISKIEVISSKILSRITYELNDTQRNFPRDKCLHQLIEEQVEKKNGRYCSCIRARGNDLSRT